MSPARRAGHCAERAALGRCGQPGAARPRARLDPGGGTASGQPDTGLDALRSGFITSHGLALQFGKFVHERCLRVK